MTKVFLPRWLSRCGALSRRAAEQAVVEGRVRVDGRVVRDVLFALTPGGPEVTLDGQRVRPAASVWFALHKPRGVVTTTDDPEGRQTVMDLVGALGPGVAPVGRLDRDSQGLILLTNDHRVAAALLDPAQHVRKVYRVKVRGHPTDAALARLTTERMTLEGVAMGPLDAVVVGAHQPASTWLEVALSEGKNRQIRRMFAAVGHEVLTLIRTSFGPVALGDLPVGAWRPLSSPERRDLAVLAP
jgi:23S rRNA pseudouridine2605 synthase